MKESSAMEKAAKEDRDHKTFEAWNAWKEVCWVYGLGKSLDGNPPIGTAEQADILRSEIARGFRRKVLPYRSQLEDEQGKGVLDDLDFANIFDNKLTEFETVERFDKGHYGEADHVRKKKAWKDFTWAAVKGSKDAPLKVIRGKLIGPLGVINQVVEEWLVETYSCTIVKDPVTGKDVVRFGASMEDESRNQAAAEKELIDSGNTLDAAASQSQDASVDDAASAIGAGEGRRDEGVSAPCEAEDGNDYGVSKTVLQKWREKLKKCLNGRQCCAIFAHVSGVRIYNDAEVLAALGVGKSVAGEMLKDIKSNPMECLRTLDEELRDWILRDPQGTKFFMQWIKTRALAEKAGPLILSRVQERTVAAK